MKAVISLLLMAICLAGFNTARGQLSKKRADSVRVIIHLDNKANNHAPVDSVFLILDRFNLTGAGVIKQVVYPVNNKIVLENVPEGKFYITVICLGIYKDHFSDVNYVYEKRKNNNEFNFRLKPAEPHDPNTVSIPAQKIDLSRLSIFYLRNR